MYLNILSFINILRVTSPKFGVVSNFARGGFVLTCNFVVIHVEWLGTGYSSYSLQRRVHVNQEAIAIREDFS